MSDRTCSIGGCTRPYRSMGYCGTHYASHRFRGEVCSFDGCERHPLARGLCNTHYDPRRGVCAAEGCELPRRTRGYCKAHYNEFTGRERACPECRVLFVGHRKRRYCSVWCKAQAKRSPVRKAVEAGDAAGIIAAALAGSVVTGAGCWEWQLAKSPAGYGMIGQGGKGGMVHRHVAAAVLGRPVGDESVHHICAVRSCVNPEHLQPVSQRENTAEMFARKFFVRRIAALEAALLELDPSHHLLP